MKDKTDSSNHESINQIEVEDRQDAITNREDFRTGLGQTTTRTIYIEGDQGMDKIIKVGQDMLLIIGVIMETIWEVTKGMADKIIIEMGSGKTFETKVMKETGVDHMIGKLEVMIEGTIEASVTVDQNQVLGWVQIEIGLDVSSVNSTIILQETTWQHKWTDRYNKFSRCSIWMKIKHYYKCQ